MNKKNLTKSCQRTSKSLFDNVFIFYFLFFIFSLRFYFLFPTFLVFETTVTISISLFSFEKKMFLKLKFYK